MKRIFWAIASLTIALSSAGIVATAAPAAAAPRPGDCGPLIFKSSWMPWRCTFVDNFNGSQLDSTKWVPMTTAQTGLRGDGDCWIDSPNNIAVANGVLNLTTRREPAPIRCTSAKEAAFDAQYTSGSVTSSGRFAQAFGRWEIRAKFPQVTVAGSHSALWLYPQRLAYGKASGEIDMGEFVSKYPDRVIPYIHYTLSSPDTTVTNNYCYVSNPTEFHVYTTVWTKDRITIAIDGKTCVDHKIHAAAPLTGSQPFDKPFMTNLTQALGVFTNAPQPDMPAPLTTVIDYVRVWS